MLTHLLFISSFFIKNQDNIYIQNIKGSAKGSTNTENGTDFKFEQLNNKYIFIDTFTNKVLDNKHGLKPNDLLFYTKHGNKNQLIDVVSDFDGNIKLMIDVLYIKYDSTKESFVTVNSKEESDNFVFVDSKSFKEYFIKPTQITKDSFKSKNDSFKSKELKDDFEDLKENFKNELGITNSLENKLQESKDDSDEETSDKNEKNINLYIVIKKGKKKNHTRSLYTGHKKHHKCKKESEIFHFIK